MTMIYQRAFMMAAITFFFSSSSSRLAHHPRCCWYHSTAPSKVSTGVVLGFSINNHDIIRNKKHPSSVVLRSTRTTRKEESSTTMLGGGGEKAITMRRRKIKSSSRTPTITTLLATKQRLCWEAVSSRSRSSGPTTRRALSITGGRRLTRTGKDEKTRMMMSSSSSFSTSTTTTTSSNETSSSSSSTAAAVEEAAATRKEKKVITRRILSGVQPTGSLHLGNYLGAIRQWVEFQDSGPTLKQEEDEEDGDDATATSKNEEDEDVIIKTENYFCVVDLHAITMPHDPAALRESTLSSAALYMAAGIDPNKSKIFVQSHVKAHSELTWLLNCITPMGWLERMIQYKDKASKAVSGDNVGVGLFTYPVLMASDILLYQANDVPVGEDQRQHLELTRDICRRFNDIFCKGNAYKKRCKVAGIKNTRPVFIEPDAIIVKDNARIMSLLDGTSKMSKSDINDGSRINIMDTPEIIRNKIKRCKTDSIKGFTKWNDSNRPEATNLLNIYSAVQPIKRSHDDILQEVKDMTWGEFKPLLAEAIINHLKPIQERYNEIRNDGDEYLLEVLKDGAIAANEVASKTLHKAQIAMGFYTPIPDIKNKHSK